MSAIVSDNTYTFISLQGATQRLGQRLEEITRDGVDGHAYRKQGKRGMPFQMIGVMDCDTLSGATTTYNALKGIEGSIVSVIDDVGDSLSGVALLSVEKQSIRKVLSGVGGVSSLHGAMLYVRLTLQSAVP